MYNPVLESRTRSISLAPVRRVIETLRPHATTANVVGLGGAIFALFCLLLLPADQYWNMRLPLYLILILWTVIRPRVALYLLPIAIPWGSLDTFSLGGLRLNSSDVLVLLLAAGWLMSFVLQPLVSSQLGYIGSLDRDTTQVPRPLLYAMLLLLFTMLLSMTGTFSITSSVKELSKWIEFLIVLLLGSQYLRTRRQIWTLILIAGLAAVSQGLYGYVQEFFSIGPQSFVRDAGLRVYGTFDQPNPYAGYINITLTIMIALVLLARTLAIRILAGAAAAILATAEYLSQSRGGEIAITVAIIFIVTLGMPRLRKLMAVGFIGGLAIIGAYLAGKIPEHYLLPILRILGLIRISFTAPSTQDFSTAERLAHWIAGINMFIDHPLTGVGIGAYGDAYAPYHITIFINSLGHAHNYYINMAAETGILGLTAFILFLIVVFVTSGRAYRAITRRFIQVRTQRAHPQSAITALEAHKTSIQLRTFADDRALAVGIIAALLSVCVHNFVDNLYVHAMSTLFALLLIALIRLEGVTSIVGNTGG